MLGQVGGALQERPQALSDKDRAAIARLRAERTALRAERAELWSRLAPIGRLPAAFALTPTEAATLAVFLRNDQVPHDLLYEALCYGAAEPAPAMKIVDVMMCKVRKKLRPFGIDFETIHGRGGSLRPQAKALVFRIMKAESEATGRPMSEFVQIDFGLNPWFPPKCGRLG